MPNIDNLMQEWPLELEEKFSSTSIPNPDLDCDLQTYAAIICSKSYLKFLLHSHSR